MPSSLFLILRRMRAPLIALIAVYALTISGLVAIPGLDEQGRSVRMDFLHAFYFVSYTATTIGFGEIPRAFTPAQRLWVTFCIYLTVIAWSYAFVKLLALVQDPWFQQALRAQHFKRQVQGLTEPFYLVCSYGDAGSLLCRALDELGRRFVIVDPKPSRIAEVEVTGYRTDTPALAADARVPDTLLLAGLQHRCCVGVLALTDDDHGNLAIAAAAHLLRPDLPALCRAEHPAVARDMALFEVEHVIDSHGTFGDYLVMAIQSPGSYQLHQWLTGMPGTSLGRQTEPPRGPWLIYGKGLFAQAVSNRLQRAGIDVMDLAGRHAERSVPGAWDGAAADDAGLLADLDRAGIQQAAGFVAGSDDDVRNLSVVVAARKLNPRLFFVLRQNREATQPLLAAFRCNITVTSTEIVVHECLARLTAPLLPQFLRAVAARDDAWADATLLKLRGIVSREVPAIWTVELSAVSAPACADFLKRQTQSLRLDHLLRESDSRDLHLRCVPLLIARRGAPDLIMPGPETPVAIGDRLLFAGTPDCQQRQAGLLLNINVLHYVYFGHPVSGSWLMRRLRPRPDAGMKDRKL